jgi:hypothetical protein
LEAFLSAVILGPLLLRFGYVVSELMVEYRTYPAMPWVALLFAVALIQIRASIPRIASAAAIALLVCFTGISHARSATWSSSTSLFSDILANYPLQLRAYNGLSDEDLRAGRFHDVLKRAPEFFSKLDQLLKFNQRSAARYYENWPLCVVTEECNIADALLETDGPATARARLQNAARQMKANHIRELDLWGLWHFEFGKVEMRDSHPAAAEAHFTLTRAAAIPEREMRKAWVQRPR